MDLKELRKRNGFSQEKASKLLRIPLRTYKRYEHDPLYRRSYRYFLMLNSLKTLKSNNEKKKKDIIRKYKIVVAGAGYVGLSLACLLSRNHYVTITDIVENKVDLINNGLSPFRDPLIEESLSNNCSIKANLSKKEAYLDADFVIVATPTNFNVKTNSFDTSSIENVITMISEINQKAIIVIKSTIPLGYTKYLAKKYSSCNILFSPEFLREGKALYDNLYPARIIVGHNAKNVRIAKEFGTILQEHSLNNAPLLLMNYEEAEAVKLFANAYLAMRVSFFNELDTYAETKNIEVDKIIKGICLDPRIGDYYNNPSFGYGGYCLPKDTAQLAKSFLDIPNNNLIRAIVQSNITRKKYIAEKIISNAMSISRKSKDEIVVGVYLLSMKLDSDNYRSSSTLDVVELLISKGIKIVIFDPKYSESERNFDKFIKECDYYISNRFDAKLESVRTKLYSRDIFARD